MWIKLNIDGKPNNIYFGKNGVFKFTSNFLFKEKTNLYFENSALLATVEESFETILGNLKSWFQGNDFKTKHRMAYSNDGGAILRIEDKGDFRALYNHSGSIFARVRQTTEEILSNSPAIEVSQSLSTSDALKNLEARIVKVEGEHSIEVKRVDKLSKDQKGAGDVDLSDIEKQLEENKKAITAMHQKTADGLNKSAVAPDSQISTKVDANKKEIGDLKDKIKEMKKTNTELAKQVNLVNKLYDKLIQAK